MAKIKNIIDDDTLTYDSFDDEIDIAIATDQTIDDAIAKTMERQLDGEVVDIVEMFHNGEELKIMEINISEGSVFYAIQLEWGNAYYRITSSLNLDDFKEIVRGIFFGNM